MEDFVSKNIKIEEKYQWKNFKKDESFIKVQMKKIILLYIFLEIKPFRVQY